MGEELTDFLLARITEDEVVARAAERNERSGRWQSYPMRDVGPDSWTMTGVGVEDDEMGHRTETMFPQDAEHIARHDPARVLAECEAKRRIVIAWSSVPYADHDLHSRQAHETSGHVFRCLALAYRDHPDYREEWKP